VRGNPGKRPTNENEPKPDLVLPEAAESVANHPRALAHWNLLAPKLSKLQILTEIDGGAFSALCTAYGRWQDAEAALLKYREKDQNHYGLMVGTTNGNKIQSPLVGTANKAMELYKSLATEFGGTPSSRSRISAGNGGDNVNPFSDLFPNDGAA